VGVFAAPADPGRDDAQIANTINDVLKSQGVGVIIKATHHYMTTRGVHKPGMEPVTRMSGFGAKWTFNKTAVVDRSASCAFGSSKWLPITIV